MNYVIIPATQCYSYWMESIKFLLATDLFNASAASKILVSASILYLHYFSANQHCLKAWRSTSTSGAYCRRWAARRLKRWPLIQPPAGSQFPLRRWKRKTKVSETKILCTDFVYCVCVIVTCCFCCCYDCINYFYNAMGE